MYLLQIILIAPEDRQLSLDDVQGMFILLGGGILLSALTLLIENIKRKIDIRKTAKIKMKKQHLRKLGRSKSLTVKENVAIESFRPLTTY